MYIYSFYILQKGKNKKEHTVVFFFTTPTIDSNRMPNLPCS